MDGSADHEAFYARLVMRHAGLITAAEQQSLRDTVIAVAGCGAAGGATVEALVRLGAEHLRLAEHSTVELADLNRHRAGLADVGENKGSVLARRVHTINPYVRVDVVAARVDDRTARTLVRDAGVVIDSIGACLPRPGPAWAGLHDAAARARVPVVSGYTNAGRQTVVTCDYRHRHDPLPPAGPAPAARTAGPDERPASAVYTADLFGAIAARTVVDLLAGRRVRHRVVVDLHHLSRPWPFRLGPAAARRGRDRNAP